MHQRGDADKLSGQGYTLVRDISGEGIDTSITRGDPGLEST